MIKNFQLLLLLSICTFGSKAQVTDSLIHQLQNAKSDTSVYALNIELGNQLMSLYPDSARDYFLSALLLANNLKSETKKARSLTLIGVTFYLNGQFEQAMNYYLMALPISEATGNKRYSGIISNNIGAVYFEMKDYESTMPYYLNAVEYFKIAQDTFWLSNSLNNLANLYLTQKKYQQSINMYSESLSMAEKSGNKEAIGSSISNLGNVFMEMGELDKALLHYKKGLKIEIESGDKAGEAITYNNIGQIYTQKEEYEDALKNHKKALLLAKDIGHLETIKNASKWLSEVYNKMGHYEEAYMYQSKFMVLKDSLTGIEKAHSVQELTQKYQSEQKERKIAELELQRKSTALELISSKNQRNIFISTALILLILAGFIWYRYLQNKKISKLLKSKNLQISKSLEERETLLKEIHHRVKNNLQIITSLLNLQAESLQNKDAIIAVKESQFRIKSMALIHQKLYQESDLRGVDVKDYLENLAKELFNAYGVDTDLFTYKVDTNNLKLDIDTVIPMGLILNELITNTLKYAFVQRQSGALYIHIQEVNNKLKIMVKDNGIGMSKDAIQSSNSFGWKMIKSLGRKLKAEIEVENNQGTSVYLSLSRYKLVL